MVQQLTNFLENKRNQKILKVVFYSLIAVLYFAISLTFIYKLGTYQKMNVLFGTDSARVFYDWTSASANHYRTKVHPLYVIFVYPIICIFRLIVKNPAVAVAIFTAITAVLTIFVLDKILTKLSKNSLILSVLKVASIVFFALSFTMFENVIVVESFLISALSVLVVWYVFLRLNEKRKNGEKFTALNYVCLALSGILSFSFLITNYFYFVLMTALLFVFHKHENKKQFFINFAKFAIVNVVALGLSYILCLIQAGIFKSSYNSFNYMFTIIKDVISGTKYSEEMSYVSSTSDIGFKSLINLVAASFIFSFFGYKANLTTMFEFNQKGVLNYIFFAVFAALFIYSVILIVKNKKILEALPFALSLLFEYLLHTFYGNAELMLYSIQMALPIVIIIYIGISSEEKPKMVLAISGVLALLSIIDIVFNSITLAEIVKFFKGQYFIEYSMPVLTFIFVTFEIIIVIALIILILFLIKIRSSKEDAKKYSSKFKKVFISVLAASIVVAQIGSQFAFALVENKVNKERAERHVATIGMEDQIYGVNMTMVFGMGLRQKFVVEKLGRYKGEAVFYEYNPSTGEKEIVDDNLTVLEYSSADYYAKLKDETTGEIFSVYENENGVYRKTGENVVALDESQHINIPTFEEFEHPDYMKALFGELMVNITKDGFVPNIFYYKNTSWYRDGSLAGLVLEKTNNLSQVEAYIESLDEDDVYDKARDIHSNVPGMREPDNLGQLLYLLSLVDNPNHDLIKAVITEVKRITKVNEETGKKYIEGITDYSVLPVYQTKYLIWGMNKLIDSLGSEAESVIGDFDINEYSVEGMDDHYRDLCWFFNTSTPDKFWGNVGEIDADLNQIQSKDIFPYLNWARLHYYQVKIDIWNLEYPLSRENHVNSSEFCITHMWSAAEMLLYLYDCENF